MNALMGLVMTGLTVYIAVSAIAPTVCYFTRTSLGANESQSLLFRVNSTCALNISRSELLRFLKFAPGSGLDPTTLARLLPETVSVHPQILYRILKHLGVSQWPPQSAFTVNATATAELFTLFRLMMSPVSQVESDCHADASYDPINQCCFISCSAWKWFTRAEEIVDDVWFYINIALATVALFASTTTIIAIKTKRRFPLLAMAWYLCISASAMNFTELVGRAMGKGTFCCGSNDLAQAVSSRCVFAVLYVIFHQFFSLAILAWSVLVSANMIIIYIGRPRLMDYFLAHQNRVHAIESLIGWGIPAVLAVLPYAIKGKDAYSNFAAICPTCFARDPDLEYYTLVLPNQLFQVLLGLLLGCMAILKEKRLRARKKLMKESNGIGRRSLEDLKSLGRRFALFVGSAICVGLCPTVYSSVLLANGGRIHEKISEYLECILINWGEGTCEHGAHTHYSLMVFLILNRVSHTLLFIGLLYFLFATKDAKAFWKKALQSLQSCLSSSRSATSDEYSTDVIHCEAVSKTASTAKSTVS